MAYYINKTQGIFVNEDDGVKYAEAIVNGFKTVETRNKNMLSDVVGLRVAIIRTKRGKSPTIIGYADVTSAFRLNGKWLDGNRDKTLIPKGSKYDTGEWAKWCYFLENAEPCEPYPLPASAIRHGRSWCEF